MFRRFLRARKFQLEPAYKQFIDAEKWAADNRLAELYETIDVDEYEATRRLVSKEDQAGLGMRWRLSMRLELWRLVLGPD